MVYLENIGNGWPCHCQGLGRLIMEEEQPLGSFPALEVLPTDLDVWQFARFTFCVSTTKEDVRCGVLVGALYQTKNVLIYSYFAKSFSYCEWLLHFIKKLFGSC